ncbi:type I-E CRISPR-associated protein Cas6/Cse3/CasE [Methanogenium sp. S4BF]|uniref:type I-E CRISPR-associated protein Cas6/Cse3/CasE n=1 Tax=Methanogenium sp. S4BF TaxID=1789226 RepID=UPI0024176AEC|nr:type I-E CRISPR-associated protein Cas6/Cse3/CasE [Methanogenium sp. S4BF]WFN33437.1 type I-E CRISPR-associated protein Cas6/Cse3/CasE [Methanogenium sp. S4BF]
MYFSKISLRPRASEDPIFWSGLGSTYQAHHRVWDLFSDGPDRNRDFLYRHEYGTGLPTFICVSARPPNDRYGMWNVATKEYSPVIREGQHLRFSLRANPVITRWVEGKDGVKIHKRHDVVMDRKMRMNDEGIPRHEWPESQQIVQDEGVKWLFARSNEHGFVVSPDEVVAEGYIQQKFMKKKGKHLISISTMDFDGILEVTDPEKMHQTLMEGIGPSKGFGCGLLLVKPV